MRILPIFLLLLSAIQMQAQQQADSLLSRLSGMPDDTNKVLEMRKLYRLYYASDKAPEMLDMAEKGLALSRRLNYINGLDLFLFYKASALDILGRGKEAIAVYREGLQLARSKGDSMVVADYYINIGTAHYGQGELDAALPAFLGAYHIYTEKNEKEKLSKVLNNIGVIYRKKGRYDRAEEIYKQSLSIKQSLKDTLGMAASYQNLSGLYNTTERLTEAIETQQKALAIYRQYNKVEDIAGCYNLLANIYYNYRRPAEAKTALFNVMELYQKHPSVRHEASTFHLLGIVLFDEKNYGAAIQYLSRGLALAQKYGQNDVRYDILNRLHQAEHFSGDHAAAYLHLKEATTLKDSSLARERLALVEELQAKFDLTQKDNELKINRLELGERTRQRNVLLGGVLGLMALVMAIYLGLKARIKANKRIAAQQMTLQKQEMLQREQQHQLHALQAMLLGQEQERSRIAGDLHDGLGGLLTSTKSYVNNINRMDAGAENLNKANALIDEACSEVRRISYNMMPRALSVSGLTGAVEDLARELKRQGLECTLEISGLDEPIAEEKSLMLFRVVQELVNNTLRHAKASHLLLQMIAKDGWLTIIAEDDGCGFDLEEALKKRGLGLSNIQSRVKYLQGEIDWDSRIGQGTSLSIRVPL